MRAEEYLEQIKKLDMLISNKTRERKRWAEIADGMGSFSTDEKVKSTHNPQKTANAIITYCDIDREIAELERKRNAIIKTIERLPPDEYTVIYENYVQLSTIQEIASLCDKSYEWVKKRKRRGLMLIQVMLDAK